MTKPCQGPSLHEKARQGLLVQGAMRTYPLQGFKPIELKIASLAHDTHAAFAQLFQNLIIAEETAVEACGVRSGVGFPVRVYSPSILVVLRLLHMPASFRKGSFDE